MLKPVLQQKALTYSLFYMKRIHIMRPADNNKLYLGSNLQILFCVTLIAIMGVSSIAPAFPKISEHLGVSSRHVVLLITVFTLPGIFLSPILGVMADRMGRKSILVPSLLVFGISGTACAFTTSFHMLVALRLLQGIGAAAIGSLNQTIIGDIFTGRDRVSAMGYNATVLSVGAGLYPLIGGAMATLGWNIPFLLSALAFPVAFLVAVPLASPDPENAENMGEYFKSALSHILKKEILALFFASTVIFILLYGILLAYFPFFLKHNFNASPFSIGIVISCVSIGNALGAANLGRISARFSLRRLMVFAFILYAVSISMIFFIHSIYLFIIPIMLYGFANGINIPGIQTELSARAPMRYRGAFMSLNGMVLRLGQTLGPVIAGFSFSLGGLSMVFYSSIAFAIISACILFFMLDGLQRTEHGN